MEPAVLSRRPCTLVRCRQNPIRLGDRQRTEATP
jgi:hypothetical protein